MYLVRSSLLHCPPTSAAVVDSGGQYHERMVRMEAFATWLKEVLFAAGEEEVKSLLAQSVRAQNHLLIDMHIHAYVPYMRTYIHTYIHTYIYVYSA